jgi:multifunctional 2-oxoglutarate metabolism enzyme
MSNLNSWLEDEFYQQYLHDHAAVDESWQSVFEHHATPGNGAAPKTAPAVEVGPSGQLVPIRGAAARIAQNMEASLSMPLASSQRIIPVKVIDENRRIINQHRTLVGKSKVSYAHLIGWAIVKALKSYPGLNHAYVECNGEPFRLVRP